MYTTVSTESMSRQEWLKMRKTGIGGSDAGAICGLNPYVSPMETYQDKTTITMQDKDNEAMRQGRDLEEYVARRFTEATGLRVRRSNKMYRSTEYPFMLADIDRLVVGKNAGLECKTASAYHADDWKNNRIPPHYLLQCYHYMAVTGKEYWYIAVVILGQGFQYIEIPRDEAVIQKLISIEEHFWNHHVIPKIIPEPDGSRSCDRVLDDYFKTARRDSAIPLIGFDEKLNRRAELLTLIQKLEQEQKQIEQEIKLYMKDHERASNDQYQVSWTNIETERLDTKRIKAERPEIYRDFTNVTSSRRFSIKAA